jgi:hypothetical protein
MAEEYNRVVSEVAADLAADDYTLLLDVADDPEYTRVVAELILLHGRGETVSGAIVPLRRVVDDPITRSDGQVEITVRECDDVSAVTHHLPDGSIVPPKNNGRVTYSYTLAKTEGLGWRVVEYEGGTEAC